MTVFHAVVELSRASWRVLRGHPRLLWFPLLSLATLVALFMIVAPILTLLFFVIGMGGAYIVAVIGEHVDQGQWVANLRDIVEVQDVLQGFLKAIVFGFMVSTVGCYQGYNATGGGRGVAIGTTRAVVIASVFTLVLDYFLSAILLTLMPSASHAT